MKIAIYPGSFNPWHAGHSDVLDKALMVFDKVIVARGTNPEKDRPADIADLENKIFGDWAFSEDKVEIVSFKGLLKDFVWNKQDVIAVIKGLRNGQDFEYEKSMQYWNEDLGLTMPTLFVISDREVTHISSSAMRLMEKLERTEE